jgi:hypothetical protein
MKGDGKFDPLDGNSTVWKHTRRSTIGCGYCKPHGGENKSRYGRHGKTKPRYKVHRR